MTYQFDHPLAAVVGQSNKPTFISQQKEMSCASEYEKNSLPANDTELLNELIGSIRSIGYGSILLTVHEGQLVEISKTVRLRRPTAARRK